MKKNNSSVIVKIAEIICVVALLLMTFLYFANVVSRYFIHESISAVEEIVTNMFLVLSLVGAALAARSHQHIGLNLLTDKLSPKGKCLHAIFEGIVGMAFTGYLSYYGYLRVMQQYTTGQESASLGFPIWIYGTLCLLGFVIIFAVFAEILVGGILRLKNKSYLEGKKEDKQ